MSSNVAQREAMQAVVEQGEITPMATCSAQEMCESIYVLYPSNVVQAHGVTGGSEIAVGYHAPTSTVLHSPTNLIQQGHWADYLVSE